MTARDPSADHRHQHDVAFRALLARLGETAADASREYEKLRERLVALCRTHEPVEAEALADATLDRLGHKLVAGEPIDDLRLYALGIARNVIREARTRLARARRAEADPTLQPDDGDDDGPRLERRLAALERCLAALGEAAGAFILAYYGADGGARIRARQALAQAERISVNALRNRALRLRAALERCVAEGAGDDVGAGGA